MVARAGQQAGQHDAAGTLAESSHPDPQSQTKQENLTGNVSVKAHSTVTYFLQRGHTS